MAPAIARRAKALIKPIKPIHGVGLLILAAAWLLRHIDPAPLQELRLATFDEFQRLADRPAQLTAVPVVLVDIDEASLAEIGQWPWPRTVLAALVDRLADHQVAVTGFDVLFPEYDRTSPAGARNEQRLAEAMARTPVVLGQGAIDEPRATAEPLPRRATFAELGAQAHGRIIRFGGLVRNVPELEAAASGIGVITLAPEIDGVVRRIDMVVEVGGDLYPGLALEMLRVATGQPTILLRADERKGEQSVRVQGLPRIPTDSHFRSWIHFRKVPRDLYVPAADVLAGRVEPGRLEHALVVVGSSALGLHDLRRTPVSAATPGFEVHAQVLEAVLTGGFLHRPPWVEMVEGSLVVVVGLLMIGLVPLLGATTTLVLGLGVVAALCGASWYAFTAYRLLADPVYPALCGVLLYASLSYMNHRTEEAQKKVIRDAFGRFLAPAVVERLAADPSRLKLGGEMRELTLLFGDIRGFTGLSEDLDPEDLTSLLNRFFTPMTQAILDSGGTVDKYIGDCVMAFWNAPVDVPEHARRACAAALSMQASCAALNAELAAERAPGRRFRPLQMGIGLNTDVVCVGNLGSAQRFDYSALGDGVNLASRLEGQTKALGVDIVVGERTREAARDFALVELDLIQVKGRARPERVFALLGDAPLAAGEDFRAFAERHAAALAAYRAQRWDDCEAIMGRCRELGRDWAVGGFYDVLAGRIARFRAQSPGADWDGVYVAATK